ncbi:hypothetical protein BH09PSE4_BH09PSE4_19250 [soil metagenome]
MTVTIRQMDAADAMAIKRQASQRVQLGLEAQMTLESAQDLVDAGEAWTATAGGRIVAVFGIGEQFAGVQGVAWAILAEAVGAAHLAITRFARARIAASPLVRIEAIVHAERKADRKWAELVGLRLRTELPKFGALSEPHLMFDRIA